MGKKFEPKNKTETVKQMNPTYSGGFVGFIVVVFNGEIVVVKFDDKKSILKLINQKYINLMCLKYEKLI